MSNLTTKQIASLNEHITGEFRRAATKAEAEKRFVSLATQRLGVSEDQADAVLAAPTYEEAAERLKALTQEDDAPSEEQQEPAKKRGKTFNLPFTGEVRRHREGTNRAKLIELLSGPKGATFEECMAATWGAREDMTPEQAEKTTYEGIRLLHYQVGYGLRQNGEGRIHLVGRRAADNPEE